jgi:plasmid maintenance system antidote protein VapI
MGLPCGNLVRHRLCPAGIAVEAWLRKNKRTRAWLAESIGIDRVSLWRMMMGLRPARLDVALTIEKLTGVATSKWTEQRPARRTGSDG